MALSGRIDQLGMERRLAAMERDLREMREAWNREAPNQLWEKGRVPSLSGLKAARSDDMLFLQWDATSIPDLRYYELEIDRNSRFSDPDRLRTPSPFMPWTSGYGFSGFYFYVRARAVTNDRSMGPWSPKLESSGPRPRTITPVSGVLTLPRRPDVVAVGGSAQTINRIEHGWVGRVVTLFFTVAHTVTDSSSIRLAGNFTANVNSTLTLRFAGGPYGWVEVSRITSI